MKRWQKIVTICLLVISAILLIYQRNWVALIWEIGCAYFLFESYKWMDKCKEIVENYIKHIPVIDYQRQTKMLHCYRVNCERALRKMMMLKNLNKSLFRKIEELTKINLHQAEVIKNLKKKHNVE